MDRGTILSSCLSCKQRVKACTCYTALVLDVITFNQNRTVLNRSRRTTKVYVYHLMTVCHENKMF